MCTVLWIHTGDPKSHFPCTPKSGKSLSQINLWSLECPWTLQRSRGRLYLERRIRVASLKIFLSPDVIMNEPAFLVTCGVPFFTDQLPKPLVNSIFFVIFANILENWDSQITIWSHQMDIKQHSQYLGQHHTPYQSFSTYGSWPLWGGKMTLSPKTMGNMYLRYNS